MTLNEFGKLIGGLNEQGIMVFHYEAVQEEGSYIVYWEYNQVILRADNKEVAAYDMVQVSYFAKKSNDPKVGAIRRLLDDHEIVFDYNVIYEQDNKTWHHVFDCSLL